MMSISNHLENFDNVVRGRLVEISDVSLEEEKLNSFETGYQAGWDDSAQANKDNTETVSLEFKRSLQDLAFTYQEAYQGVLKDLQPLIRQMVESILPKLGRDVLGTRVAELLGDELRKNANQGIKLITAPCNVPSLTEMTNNQTDLSVSVVANPSLMDGQVQILFASGEERELNLNQLIEKISQSIEAFFKNEPEVEWNTPKEATV